MSAPKSAVQFGAAARPAAPDIKTRYELDRLKSQRTKPAPQMQLTPKGPIRTQVHAAENTKRQSRIGQLKTALEKARAEASQQYGLNSRAGLVRAGFEKSR